MYTQVEMQRQRGITRMEQTWESERLGCSKEKRRAHKMRVGKQRQEKDQAFRGEETSKTKMKMSR
jgi:hypothetical protein